MNTDTTLNANTPVVRPPVWGWISGGNRVLVLGASLGSFVHVHDAMGEFGQSGFFAWLAAGVIELGGILGILMLSQTTRIGGALPSGILVVAACQGISLWANQAMVTGTAGPGQEFNARIAGFVFPVVVVLGLSLEIVMQRHHEREARAVRDARLAEERERAAAAERVRAERSAVVVEDRAACVAQTTAQDRPAAEDAAPRRAPVRQRTGGDAPVQRRTAPSLADAVSAARRAGVDPSLTGWYTGLAAELGGSRTWWKTRVGPELVQQAGIVRVTS
jgi:hypothetical protein